MVGAGFTAAAVAVADAWAAITAINLYYSLLNQAPAAGAVATTTPARASASSVGDDVQIFLTLFALGGLCATVALIYRRLRQDAVRAAAAAGGGGNRRLSDLMAFAFAAAGLLELLLFAPCAGGGAVDVDVAGAIGLAAFRALPAAATATFFLGMATLIFVVAHVRAGCEGGGGAAGGGFAGDGLIRRLVSFLTKMAFGAAAALVSIMALALYAKY